MHRKGKKVDEERLLPPPSPSDLANMYIEKTNAKYDKIPTKAIKSIIIAIFLVIVGIACLIFLMFSFTDVMYYAFHDHRLMLFIIGIVTIPCGGYTLIIAFNCYKNVKGYNWTMIFL